MSNPEVISEFKGAYYFLSNFATSYFNYEGIIYPSGEHAFAAAKTLDQVERRKIAEMAKPREAKHYGRQINLRPYWDVCYRYASMRGIVRAKFTQNPVLRGLLLETGDAILIEGNTWRDLTWGVDTSSGKGHNLLGFMLMDLRDELKPTMRGRQ